IAPRGGQSSGRRQRDSEAAAPRPLPGPRPPAPSRGRPAAAARRAAPPARARRARRARRGGPARSPGRPRSGRGASARCPADAPPRPAGAPAPTSPRRRSPPPRAAPPRARPPPPASPRPPSGRRAGVHEHVAEETLALAGAVDVDAEAVDLLAQLVALEPDLLEAGRHVLEQVVDRPRVVAEQSASDPDLLDLDRLELQLAPPLSVVTRRRPSRRAAPWQARTASRSRRAFRTGRPPAAPRSPSRRDGSPPRAEPTDAAG